MIDTLCTGKHVLIHDGTNVLGHCQAHTGYMATNDANTVELFNNDTDLENRITALGLIDLPADE